MSEPEALTEAERAELDEVITTLRYSTLYETDDETMRRWLRLALIAERWMPPWGPAELLAELDRRDLRRHTAQVERYADRLDRFTNRLVGLTLVIVLQTAVIVAIEVESHYPGFGVAAGLASLLLAIVASGIGVRVARR